MVRSVATQCVQVAESRQQCNVAATVNSGVDDCLSVDLLNVADASRPSSVECSTSPCTPAASTRSDGDLPTSRRRRRPRLPLDNVDLWEDSSDSELRLVTTADQTCDVDLKTADDNDDQRHAIERVRERQNWSRKNSQHGHQLSQQTPAVDERSETQAVPATSTSSAGCLSGAVIPTIIESCGRPRTANGSAAELSHGSVELHPPRPPTDAGLELFIRGMQLTLIGNGERTTRSEVKVTQAAEHRRVNDARSSNSITVQSTDYV